MSDLNRAPFLDTRMLTVLRKIINGTRVSAFSADEKYLMGKREELVKLNKTFDHGLVKLLDDCKNCIATSDAIVFLLNAQRVGKESEAKEVLEVAWTEERTATRDELKKILKESNEIPMAWAVALIGESTDDRHPPKDHGKTSSIDILKLKRFK